MSIEEYDKDATFFIVMSMVLVIIIVGLVLSARDASKVCLRYVDAGGDVAAVEAETGKSPLPDFFWMDTRKWMRIDPKMRQNLVLTGDGWCK